ncbi:OmpA family protein [Janthinobacterium lividum]|uniref:OmpA family protein n=1 Tax=Janthinobacterium lividum TaxID=29581 RepID=UPI0008930C64|nr:OmpA family protein [Janthinobacterium lividum]MCC7717391.1 OmpA family protein [Janthinobacterium lividum]OEZ48660.1 peptidoglycan-binding protein ArfA [Janthinobacterium lividum]WQE31944.1 OmpA family protein [Janthinobacterium lividum]STS86215.1 Outer membrane protein ArfA [Janthinobacterium lividum]
MKKIDQIKLYLVLLSCVGCILSSTSYAAEPAKADLTYKNRRSLWTGTQLQHPDSTAIINPAAPRLAIVSLSMMQGLRVGMSELDVSSMLGKPLAQPVPEQMQYMVATPAGLRFIATLWFNAEQRLWMADTSHGPTPDLAALLSVSNSRPSAPKVSLIIKGKALFASNSAVLLPASVELDRAAQNLLAQPESARLTVRGYTDRTGSQARNLVLSQQRADVVRAYLIRRGVAAERIVALGKGSADPIVNCPGRSSPAVVACLEPNRRVELQTD